MTRRLIFAVITATCLEHPNIGIHVFLLCNVLYIVYFGFAKPHDTVLSRRMEYINESLMQMTTYHLVLFPLVLTLADEEIAGWSMIGFVGVIFLFNLTVILVITIVTLKRKLYLRGLKKKQLSAI